MRAAGACEPPLDIRLRRGRAAANRLSFSPSESAKRPPLGAIPMFPTFVRTLVKVAVASLIVGTILAHFGITTDLLMREFGLSHDRIAEMAHRAMLWALPNLLLGSLVIVPVWFVVYLFRPPGPSSE